MLIKDDPKTHLKYLLSILLLIGIICIPLFILGLEEMAAAMSGFDYDNIREPDYLSVIYISIIVDLFLCLILHSVIYGYKLAYIAAARILLLKNILFRFST